MNKLHFALVTLLATLAPAVARAADHPSQPYGQVYVGAGSNAGTILDRGRNVALFRSSDPGVVEDIVVGADRAGIGPPKPFGLIQRLKDGSTTAELLQESTNGRPDRYVRNSTGKWTKNDVPAEPKDVSVLESFVDNILRVAKDIQTTAARNSAHRSAENSASPATPNTADRAGAGARDNGLEPVPARPTASPVRKAEATPPALSSGRLAVGQVVRDCPDCPEMVAVPQVGHSASEPGTMFFAGRYEVTWKEYLIAVRDGACPIPKTDFGHEMPINSPRINDAYPLTLISPDIFVCYLNWLNKRTGKVYRIPSADEWEHVARANTKTEYYWGDGLGYNNAIIFDYFDLPSLKARLGYPEKGYLHDPRVDVNFLSVFPVGQFKPNPWGLYDVIGNAAEITSEISPAVPACLTNNAKNIGVCAGIVARGSDRGRSPDMPNYNQPITHSLMTARSGTPAHGGGYRAGFRLVRD